VRPRVLEIILAQFHFVPLVSRFALAIGPASVQDVVRSAP